jgi:hypothetical protein
VELRARLAGLLQDVIRVEHVDVRGALAEAPARTIPCESFRIEPLRALASRNLNAVDPFAD